jgi:hypothetical protein
MDFEYKSEITKLQPKCPPEDYKSVNRTTYRWVFSSIDHPDNFKPRIKIRPHAFNDATDLQKCEGYGLSFFDTMENAKARFNVLLGLQSKKAYERFGTHVADGNISESDGVSSEINTANGHFTFHQIKNHYFEKKFKIKPKL